MEKTVLAIDPGTAKCGLALVKRLEDGKLTLLSHSMSTPEGLPDSIQQALAQAEFSQIVVGNGTGSRPIVQVIRESFPGIALLLVDEKDTTMHARERYWEHNPRRGWRRFLPSSLQVPPVEYDDFAAYVIAERVLSQAH